jgi:hypothetical protein
MKLDEMIDLWLFEDDLDDWTDNMCDLMDQWFNEPWNPPLKTSIGSRKSRKE